MLQTAIGNSIWYDRRCAREQKRAGCRCLRRDLNLKRDARKGCPMMLFKSWGLSGGEGKGGVLSGVGTQHVQMFGHRKTPEVGGGQ